VNPTDSNKARNHPTEAELETKLRRTFQAVGRAALGASSADVAPLRRSTLHYMAYRRRRLGVATLTAVSVVAALVALLIAYGPKDGSPSHKRAPAAHPPTLPITTLPTTSTPATALTPTTTPSTIAVALPVVKCPTEFAMTTSPPTTPVPTTLVMQVPSDLRSTLAVYTDTNEIEVVVAPRGWNCRASYGADGSGSISVYPSGESTPNPFAEVTIRANSTDEAITLSETGGSPLIAADTACPYFANAAAQAQQYGDRNCTPPAKSEVEPISQNAVDVAIPARQSVTGIPSGGLYVTNVVVLYNAATQPGTYLGSCTLPQDEHAVCTAVLNDVLARYGDK
jgi:hypothetical protein